MQVGHSLYVRSFDILFRSNDVIDFKAESL